MNRIDLSTPSKKFDVPTQVSRGGTSYMGPDVRVDANNSAEAVARVQTAGHTPNSHFAPQEVKPWPR